MGNGEEKDPKALRLLLARLHGLALSKRERLVVEDLVRKAFDEGLKTQDAAGAQMDRSEAQA